jgi:parafibromin
MASSTDPLVALRTTLKSQTPISFTKDGEPTPSLNGATHIVLGSQSFPRNAPTRLRKPDAAAASSALDPAAEPGAFFGLDAVYLAWLGREASGAEYVKEARDNGLSVGFVSVTERKTVADWLEGRSDELKGLVPLAGTSWSFL